MFLFSRSFLSLRCVVQVTGAVPTRSHCFYLLPISKVITSQGADEKAASVFYASRTQRTWVGPVVIFALFKPQEHPLPQYRFVAQDCRTWLPPDESF
jgi:hypothetical protein